METETNNSLRSVLAVVALALGGALLGWSLYMLPHSPAYGFPWEFACAVLSFLPMAVGAWFLGGYAAHSRGESRRYRTERGGGVVAALWIIIAGVLLLCFNGGMLPAEWRRVFFSWQMLFLVGAMGEFAQKHITEGVVLLGIGGFFIIRRLEPLYPDLQTSISLWPVLLILLGLLILGNLVFNIGLNRGSSCHGRHCKGHRGEGGGFGDGGTRASGVISITTVFGGTEQVYLDPEFRGGKISTVFGGVKLDLRRTGLPEGVTYLTIESVFGGVEIDAPEEWNIEIHNESVFGSFADKRLPAVNPGYSDGRKLIIRASNVFGGGEIK